MATKVECSLITCTNNGKENKRSGVCKNQDISLKWRFAADMGRGSIVCVECLMFSIEEKNE